MARRGMLIPVQSGRAVVWAPVALIAVAVVMLGATALWPAPAGSEAAAPERHTVRLGDGPAIAAGVAWLEVQTLQGMREVPVAALDVGPTWDAGEAACVVGPGCPIEGEFAAIRLLVSGLDVTHRIA